MRLDDELRDAIDAYATKFFPKPNGNGSRTEAVRQILKAVLALEEHPVVAEVLGDDLILNNDVLVFIRTAASDYIKARQQADETHTLQ